MVPDIDLHVLTDRVPLMVLETVKERLWVKDRVTLEHPDELPEVLLQNESEGEPEGEPEGDAEKDPTDKRLGRGLTPLSPPTWANNRLSNGYTPKGLLEDARAAGDRGTGKEVDVKPLPAGSTPERGDLGTPRKNTEINSIENISTHGPSIMGHRSGSRRGGIRPRL